MKLQERREAAMQAIEKLHNKDFVGIRRLVQSNPAILWQPVSAQITFMHVAARSMILEQYAGGRGSVMLSSSVLDEQSSQQIRASSCATVRASGGAQSRRRQRDWWKWLLEAASKEQPEMFFRARDRGGDTCLDIFLRSWLSPSDAKRAIFPFVDRLSDALDRVVRNPSDVQLIDQLLEQHDEDAPINDGCARKPATSTPVSTHDASDVFVVYRFWRAFRLLCMAAAAGTDTTEDYDDDDHNGNDHVAYPKTSLHNTEERFPILPFLAQTGCCPEPIARFVVALEPHAMRLPNEHGYLPIHLWCVSPNLPEGDEDQDGFLRPLLEADPRCATITDPLEHRLPLHLALEHGKSLTQITRLWRSNPATLYDRDVVSELPCCGMLVQVCKKKLRAMKRGVQKRGCSTSLNDWLDSSRDNEGKEEQLACDHLSAIYDALRTYPLAIL